LEGKREDRFLGPLMRIAFVIDTVEPFYFGGYEKRAYELARRLARRHEVTILTSGPRERVIEGMRYISIRPQVSTFDANGYRSTKEALWFAWAVARACVAPQRFDVVDCNATPFVHIPSTWLLARRSGAKLVLSVHEGLLDELDPYFVERGARINRFSLGVLRYGYRKVHSLPDCVLACSELTARKLSDEGIAPGGITHGGVGWLGERRHHYFGRVVCIARLVPPKRMSIAIRAFAIARARGDANHLAIVGDGPERPELERLIDELKLRDHVEIKTGMTEEKKRNLLAEDSDLCLSASLREGLSIATLECLGAGLPALISSRPDLNTNGALDYMIDGVNGIVTDGGVESLAAAIGRISRDPSLFTRLSQGALETARRYTWDEAALELESTYWRMLGANREGADGTNISQVR
jgi:glycosyltransferase involved in cell wall biosynthesis